MGAEIDQEYPSELFQDVCNKSMEMCVNLGLFNTVVSHWPEQVQKNFLEREQGIVEWLEQQIEEIQAFAEAFDG